MSQRLQHKIAFTGAWFGLGHHRALIEEGARVLAATSRTTRAPRSKRVLPAG